MTRSLADVSEDHEREIRIVSQGVPCVCGHAEFLHTSLGCLKWFRGCGCASYHPDDGSDQGTLVVPSEPYEGIYARRYSA
jgi:hypothetical protein